MLKEKTDGWPATHKEALGWPHHPQRATPVGESLVGPPVWPSEGGAATPRAIRGGQDHPLMGIGGG
jgi:hypothetical protein